jgi:CRISPR-associated protein Csd1
MILQALKEYYDRKAADPESGIAPLGWKWKEIPFLVVIDIQGRFLRFEDTRETIEKKLRKKSFLVPSLGEAKGNGIKANLFWENAEYMFGIPMRENSKPERVAEQHAAFKRKIHSLPVPQNQCTVVEAVKRFTDHLDTVAVTNDPQWPAVKELNQPLLLAVNGIGAVTDDAGVREAVQQASREQLTGEKGLCLVTGDAEIITLLEDTISGVQGASTMGAHLVAVNNKITGGSNAGQTPAFASFFKEQGANSPIGKTASLAYTTALNTLLAKDSRQKMQVGDATTVFWADKATQMEESFIDFWAEPPKDDPDRLASAVRALFESVETGAFVATENNTRFHVLGLAPNAARIAIRFWHTSTIPELARNIRAYFEDLRIVHGPRDQEDLSPWRLLVSTAVQGKTENINPNLAGQVMRSILEGLPFPAALLQAAVIRIKAERDVSYPRAKLVKGCLNRKSRTQPNPQERMLTMSLDKENTNVGYCLGRLFAVLEKIQQEANPGINATIRDKFYAAASSAPSTVFGNLMRLKNYNLSKLESTGRRIWFEKLIGEIVDKVSTFPAHLKLDDQGRFAIGYYHQMQDLWTKKSDKTPTA